MEENFTETELRNALTDLGWTESMINPVIRDLKPTWITRDQLLSSLTINQSSPDLKIGVILSQISQLRNRNDSQVPFDEQTITRAELRRTLQTVLTGGRGLSKLSFSKAYYNLDSLINDLFRKAPEPTEPGYTVGTVYRDSNGKLWRREADDKWTQFGRSTMFDGNYPPRPLTDIDA